MNDQRPDPEKLLQRVHVEEQKNKRGKLKIYLGAAPGVGKTHEMLHDALGVRTKELDVVVGIVESHGRKEINDMLKDFEILPKQTVLYHEKPLLEFDLTAALNRNPGLILMDEMAHTNAPGLRHSKRWQDIKELLDRGINVYTTLNVQHIESLNDKVSQIIHAPIKETVPDHMIDMADTIELVDLPPEELLKRLSEGKIYVPEQAKIASELFFRKGNLIALRELALRVTAESVDAQLLIYRQSEGIKHIWSTKEKILVCVGSGPESIKLIRVAKRLSVSFKAPWMAIYVDSPRSHFSENQRNAAIQNLQVAEHLGAQIKVLMGYDMVKEIMSFAHEQNATLIMMWKSVRPRFSELFSRRLADEVMRHSGEIDVYIMTGKQKTSKMRQSIEKKITPWRAYAISLGVIGLATLINFFIHPFLSTGDLIMVYLVAVTLVALLGKPGPSILASVLSVTLYDFFFIQNLTMPRTEVFFTLSMMLLVSHIISSLLLLAKRQTISAKVTEKRIGILHALSRQLASARGVDKLLKIGIRYMAQVFNSGILAFMPHDHDLVIRARSKTKYNPDDKELSVAKWVYDLGQMAGAGTDTLTFSEALFIPLLASQSAMGVLRICPDQHGVIFTSEQIHLLEACANQIALALEVDWLQEQTKRSELQTEVDRTQNKLLQFISHELRTPLESIMVSAYTEVEHSKTLKPHDIKKLGAGIYSESLQLNRLINNLLQITYLESEKIQLQKQPHNLADIITLAVNSKAIKSHERPITLHIPKDLEPVPVDTALIQTVLIELLDNAIKFSDPNAPIDITVVKEKYRLLVTVQDHGPGIVKDEVDSLFEKFYRGRLLTSHRGLGLGLALCKKIIEAHGGKIWAENVSEGGAAFTFTLPL